MEDTRPFASDPKFTINNRGRTIPTPRDTTVLNIEKIKLYILRFVFIIITHKIFFIICPNILHQYHLTYIPPTTSFTYFPFTATLPFMPFRSYSYSIQYVLYLSPRNLHLPSHMLIQLRSLPTPSRLYIPSISKTFYLSFFTFFNQSAAWCLIFKHIIV